jgi:hypothetical protein
MVLNSKLPFKIIFCWIRGLANGHQIADHFENIYGFENDPKQPLPDIHLDKLEYVNKERALPILEDSPAEKTLIVFLAHDNQPAISELYSVLVDFQKNDRQNVRILTIALNSNIFDVSGVNSMEAVRAYEFEDEVYRLVKIEQAVSHELYKLFLGNGRKVQLFLSHSKHDYGKELAEQFQNFLCADTKIRTFFDVHDIDYGDDFEKTILDNLNESTLLIIQTDNYATRNWCVKEVLESKRAYRPIIRWLCLQKGELRSNPYFGNTPTLVSEKWDENSDQMKRNFDTVVNKALKESLRYLYFEKYVKYKSGGRLSAEEGKHIWIIPFHPEVINITFIRKNRKKRKIQTVIYPDPALGEAEMELLKSFFPEIEFLSINQITQS